MYRIKLIKALSYNGIVKATKAEPFVEVKDKATAENAVATGYFELVSAPIADEVAAEPPKKAAAKRSNRKEN